MAETDPQYDVFLTFSREDKAAAAALAKRLEAEAALAVLLDPWNLAPGATWPEDLKSAEAALDAARATAILVGPGGRGTFQHPGLGEALGVLAADAPRRVIPVLLPGAEAALPESLGMLTPVDFRAGLDAADPLAQLAEGIAGKPPEAAPPPSEPPPAPAPASPPQAEPAPPEDRAPPGGVRVGDLSNISGGEINIAGGSIEKRTIHTGGGAYIGGSVHTGGGDFVGRDKSTTHTGVAGEDLAALFEKIYGRIAERPSDPDVDKPEIKAEVEKIEEEVKKGEEANEKKVERWMTSLGSMAPDILDVVVDTLANPALGIKTVVQKIAAKAKGEGAGEKES